MTAYSRNGVLVTEAEAAAIDAGKMRAPEPGKDYKQGDQLPPELRDPEYIRMAAHVLELNGFAALAKVLRVELGGAPELQPQPVQPTINPMVASQLAVTPVVVPPIPMGGTQPGGTAPAEPPAPPPAPAAEPPAPQTPPEGQPQS